VRRLPIRLRLTLAFTLVMAVVLAAIGLTVYLRFSDDLDANVDRALRSRADDLAGLVSRTGPGLQDATGQPLLEREESFAQVLDERGRVLDASAQLPDRPLLSGAELRRARAGTITVERRSVLEADEQVRLLGAPAEAEGRRLVVVVGASLDENDEALASLGLLLLIGGPVALLLASVAGYGVAAGALRPVDAMRRKAAVIRDDRPGERLPVPEARDEIRGLAETLNEMLARLEHALERERSFVTDASHELRTPLAILKAELELALRAGRSEEELRSALRSAAEETDRLNQLADDLLVLARSDRGGLPLRIEPIEAREILDSVAERFGRRARDAGRPLVVDSPSGLRIAGDRLRLEQALSNLVENALRHGAGPVRLSAGERGEHVELHVEDEGTGFPSDFADEAFERFTRAHQGRTGGGAGLGLAIVRAIATAHGGHAAARNRPGSGADVWMELPRAQAPAEQRVVETV
jgi:two-component system, OmpR family, sensor kinase